MAKINLLDFLTAGDKIYTDGQVYEVTKNDKVLSTDGEVKKEEKEKD